jgi:hypothetical protein
MVNAKHVPLGEPPGKITGFFSVSKDSHMHVQKTWHVIVKKKVTIFHFKQLKIS